MHLNEIIHNLTATVATLSSTVDKLVAAKVENRGIATLSDHPVVVVSVYMLSFVMWGLLSNLGFISEKVEEYSRNS